MKLLNIVLLLLLILIPYSNVYSEVQTDTEIVIDKETSERESTPVIKEDSDKKTVSSVNRFFELELLRGPQSPFNKGISYTLYITPKLDSARTQILWEVPTTFETKIGHREFLNLKKNETYKYQVSIYPKREGTYEITANVISWQHDTNYTNSVSSEISLNKNLVVQPVDSEYSVTIMLMVVGGIVFLIMGGFIVYKISKRLLKKLKLWLTPPY
jgi:hypothetical protein